MANNDIIITIDGKSHHFRQGDLEAFKDLPWPERKQLIELLEDIKQADYVKKSADVEALVAEEQSVAINTTEQQAVAAGVNFAPQVEEKVLSTTEAGLDPSIKKSEQDVDDLMQRLIVENQQHRKPVPDRSAALKLLAVIALSIVLLAVIF